MSVLTKIVEMKEQRLASARAAVSLSDLKSMVRDAAPTRSFREAVTRNERGVRFITEVKKASPSKGLLRKDFDHLRLASVYASGGADAISVITEEDFFQGSLRFLDDIRRSVPQPVLRKDFVIDAYQLYEARAYGADAVLLIAAILDRHQASDLLMLAGELGMGVLFEVHDRMELDMVLETGAPIIGINNRNLKTLDIDLSTTHLLKKDIPHDRLVVSESGIRTRQDVQTMEAWGVDALLIGTCLVEAADISAKLRELRGRR